MPLRMHLDWLISRDISIKKIAAHCDCSVEQIHGLKSGKWQEPASPRMEYKILELVENTYFSEHGEGAGKRRPPERLSTYYVPRPSFMPQQPPKDPTNAIAILNFYKQVGFTERIICEITGMSEREFEVAYFGFNDASCRRKIINSLDKYQDFFF